MISIKINSFVILLKKISNLAYVSKFIFLQISEMFLLINNKSSCEIIFSGGGVKLIPYPSWNFSSDVKISPKEMVMLGWNAM